MPRSRPLYSSSALQVAQYVFTRSVAEPTKLTLDGAAFGDELPPGRLLLLPLRDLLLRPQTSPATRDAVWRELIRRAREDRSSWLVAAMGMAMPGLRRAVRELLVGFRGDRDDLESSVAEGFVTALYTTDVDDRALCGRLIDAGRKAGAKQVFKDADLDGAAWSQFASRAPQLPWGHPDFVLVDAVRAGVLSLEEAQLIGVTRLEHVSVKDVALWLGERPNTLVARRRRAEERLRQAIVAGDVECRSAVPSTQDAGPDPAVWVGVGPCEPAARSLSVSHGGIPGLRNHRRDVGVAVSPAEGGPAGSGHACHDTASATKGERLPRRLPQAIPIIHRDPIPVASL